MICPQCGTENRLGDKFCEQCGFPLPAESAGSEDNIAATMVGAPIEGATLVRVDDPSETFELGGRMTVGRLDNCDIAIHDKSVSREHARLSQLPGGYVIEDLGSTNGTLVNGDRLEDPVILRPGDTVTFGSIEYRFEEQRAGAPSGGDAASTQPFVYRPVESTQREEEVAPREPAPAVPAPPPAWSAPTPEPEDAPAFDFPPLQPFSPVEPAAPEPAPPRAEPLPTSQAPDGWVPQPAAPSAPPPPAPEPQAWQGPAEQQQGAPEPASWKSPAPLLPTQPGESAAGAEEQGVAPPPQQPVSSLPSPPVPAVSSSAPGTPDEAVAVASRLVDLVRSLASAAGEREARESSLQARVDELERANASRDDAVRVLNDVPVRSIPMDQLRGVQDTLDQLIQNPRDIELLLQLGRRSADLAAIVNEYAQLRRIVERLQAAMGTSTG